MSHTAGVVRRVDDRQLCAGEQQVVQTLLGAASRRDAAVVGHDHIEQVVVRLQLVVREVVAPAVAPAVGDDPSQQRHELGGPPVPAVGFGYDAADDLLLGDVRDALGRNGDGLGGRLGGQ